MKKLLSIALLLATVSAFGQSSWDRVYTILETKCQSCHSGGSPAGQLDLTGSPAELYDRLFEESPSNVFAAERNYKLIDAGYPDRSFMYRKSNWGLYAGSNLEEGEGASMPTTGDVLTDAERDIMRSWILFGAPESGLVGNPDAIEDYYTEGGLDRIEPPAPPAEGEGFQLHLGTIFLEPGEEREYIIKHELRNPESIEIPRLEVRMNDDSHHFLFFRFDEGADQDENEGLEEVTIIGVITGGANAITNDTKMIGGWAYDADIQLPNKVAYSWDANTVLKLNYHIKNYSTTAVMPAELFVNVYTQDVGTATHEMLSEFQLSTANPFQLNIPPGESKWDWTLDSFDGASSQDSVHLWLFGAHTHQYGVDFNAWQRLENGSKGPIIYEGSYNFDYTFDTGFYDYSHPPMRIFDEFLSMRAGTGLQIEADYNNTSNENVTFGLTTADEMFGAFLQYIVGDISDLDLGGETGTGIEENTASNFSIHPNPVQEVLSAQYNLNTSSEVVFELFDLSGRLVYSNNLGTQAAGLNTIQINRAEIQLPAGVYTSRISGDKLTLTEKVVLN